LAKRVLIYTNHFHPEQFKINEIVGWLSSQENHIRVITGLPNYPSGNIITGYSDKIYKKILINRLLLIPRGNASNLMLLINYLSYFISCSIFTLYIAIFKKKYDIIFVHHTSPIFISIHPILYSLFHKSKKILWDLDIWPESLKAVGVVKSKIFNKLIKSIVKWIYSKYDSILVSSKPLVKIVQKRYNGKVIYFPNWADKVVEQNQVKKNYNINVNSDKFNIIYTGNLGKSQNLKSLVSTIESVDNNIHWIFVGGGRTKQEFLNELKSKDLINKTTFIDQVKIDKIPTIARSANALFLSLKKDEIFSKTVPAKLQTYMALGKPIIGVLNGEGARLIIESNCGLVVENYDYLELVKKINNFAHKSDFELNILGTNAKKFYNKNFNSKHRKQQILKIIYE
tara:strand:+ start:968 stop:2161 length:1194 start_codon:yes stop_codon:yes gene_type:complete